VWSGEEQDNFRKVLDAFEQKTGAKVTFTSTGDEIATVLGTRVQGGNPPDVAMLPQPGLMADLAKQNAIKPIKDVAGDAIGSNFAPVWGQLGSVNGTLYGLWFKAANKSTFWYDKKALTEAGVQPPATWEDLKKAAQQLSDSGRTPFSVGAADGWVMTDWFENVYLRTAGADMYDKLSKHEIPWTDPSVKKALTTMGDVFSKPEWIAGGPSGALQTEFPASVSAVFGQPPKAAMVYEGDFVATTIKKETSAQLGTDADFFNFPSVDGSKPVVVGGGDVAVLMKDNPGGKELFKFLATPEAAEVWAALGGFTSPNQNVKSTVYHNDTVRKSADALVKSDTFRFHMSDLQPAAFGATKGAGEWKILQDYVSTPTDVDGIAGQLESAAAQAYTK